MSDQGNGVAAPAYDDVHGVPNEEQALASVATHREDGVEISEGQRKQIAENIIISARQNASWRASLPYDQQMALANVPVVSAPPADAPAETSAQETQGAGV